MDTLTHLVAGALTPLAFKDAPRSRLLIPFGILCGELPDIDILAGSSAEAFLSVHRGITHALAVQPFSALLMALLFHRLLKRGDAAGSWTFGKTWLAAFIALCIHVYLDCMTTFGTRIFLPFSDYRVAVPGLFIVDLLLTLPILAVFVILLRRGGGKTAPFRRLPLVRAALAWIIVYPALSFGVGQASVAALVRHGTAVAGERDIRRVHLTPEPFAPFNWKLVAEQGDAEYLLAPFSLLDPDGTRAIETYRRVESVLWRELQRKAPLIRMYADFASFPVVSGRRAAGDGNPAGTDTILVVEDLRYVQFWKKTLAFFGRSDGMFILEVCLDAHDEPVAWRFLQRGADRPHTPWRRG
jgi:inner membrane protein